MKSKLSLMRRSCGRMTTGWRMKTMRMMRVLRSRSSTTVENARNDSCYVERAEEERRGPGHWAIMGSLL